MNLYHSFLQGLHRLPDYPDELASLLPLDEIPLADPDTLRRTVFSLEKTMPVTVDIAPPAFWRPPLQPAPVVRFCSPLEVLQQYLGGFRRRTDVLIVKAHALPEGAGVVSLMRTKAIAQAEAMNDAARQALRILVGMETVYDDAAIEQGQAAVSRVLMLNNVLKEQVRETVRAGAIDSLTPFKTFLTYLQNVYRFFLQRGPEFRGTAERLGLIPSAVAGLTLGALAMITITLPTT